MKNKINVRRIIATVLAISILVTGLGFNAFAAADHVIGSKAKLSYRQYAYGMSILKDSFNNHSIQKLWLTEKGTGEDIAAFCVAPGVAINTDTSYSYEATSDTMGYATKYYKGALSYRLSHQDDISRIAVQLWCWQIYKANAKAKGKDFGANDVVSATSGFQNLFINVLSGNFSATAINFEPLSKSEAQSLYNTTYDYIVVKGAAKAYKDSIELLKWTCPSAQTVISGRAVKERQVAIQVYKKGSATGNNAYVVGCQYKVYSDAACTKPIKSYGSGEDAVMTIGSNGNSNKVFLDATDKGAFTVYVKEVSANNGTVLNNSIKNVSFSASDNEKNVKVVENENNERTVRFNLHKKGSDGSSLSGVTFTTYQQSSKGWVAIESKTTGNDGKLSFGPYAYTKNNNGRFRVVETNSTNTKFINTNWSADVNMNETKDANPTYTYEPINPEGQNLIINKLDAQSGAMIGPDAGFMAIEIPKDYEDELYRLNYSGHDAVLNMFGSEVPEQFASERQKDGSYVIKGLKANTVYVLEEIQIPFGYLKGPLSINTALPKLLTNNASLITDLYNRMNSNLSAANSFVRSNYYIPIRTSANQVTGGISINIYDTEASAQVYAYKYDSVTGNKPQGNASLGGAVFGLYRQDDDVLVATATTNQDGMADFGKVSAAYNYNILEISPPPGYRKATEDSYTTQWGSSIRMRNYTGYEHLEQAKSTTVKNEVIAGKVKVYKYSTNNGESFPLSGVKFGIFLTSSLPGWAEANMIEYDYSKYTPVTTIVSGSDGYATSKDLPYGQYVVVELQGLHNFVNAEPQLAAIDDSFLFDREPVYLEFFNEPFRSKITIVKKDSTTGETVIVPGNTFKILNVDTGKYVKQMQLEITSGSFESGEYTSELVETSMFTTDETGSVTLPDALVYGNYQIEEVEASTGYELNTEPVPFTIDSDMEYDIDPDTLYPIITVNFENKPKTGSLLITKRGEALSGYTEDFEYKNESLAGAEYSIYAAEDIYKVSDGVTVAYAKDELVATVVTDDTGVAVAKDLLPANYYVKETVAPYSYVLSAEVKDVEITYSKSRDVEQEIVFTNERQKVEIRVTKVDKETQKILPDATFGLYAADDIVSYAGEVIVPKDTLLEQAVSDVNGVAKFTKDYPIDSHLSIKELSPPPGYITSEEVVDVVVSASTQDVKTVVKEYVYGDEPKSIQVTKYDITTSKESPGNALQVSYVGADGKEVVVDSWISTAEPHFIKYLVVNREYILTETKPGDGYTTAENVKFTVKDDSTIDSIAMYNDITKVQISKTDITTGEKVIGARLQIIDMSGTVIKDFLTTENDQDMYFERIPIGRYILREIQAPTADGYVKSADVEFEVLDNNEIQRVEMVDDYTKVAFYKKDSSTGEGVKKAYLTLTDSAGNIVDAWETDGSKHVINYLAPGTYKLSESITPLGYETAEDITVEVSETGEVQEFVMEDKRTTGQIYLVKKDRRTKEVLEGAEFSVVDEATGEEVDRMVSGVDGIAASQIFDIANYENGECIGMRTFIVKEVKSPKKYELDETEYKVTFNYVDGANNIIVYNIGDVYNVRKDTGIPITGDYFNTAVPIVFAAAVIVLFGITGMFSGRKKSKLAKTK